MTDDLERFVAAQDGVYAQALAPTKRAPISRIRCSGRA
jgi:uncharacterized protein (DUF1810 family)